MWLCELRASFDAKARIASAVPIECTFSHGAHTVLTRNPRLLFGLMQALHAQGREHDAEWVGQQFQAAWKNADTKLRVEDL
jgi:hypothetical protein